MIRIAVIDDWQRIARQSADWAPLEARAEVVFFHDAFADQEHAASALAEFDVIMSMRERSAFPASLIERLPRLKLFSMTGLRAGSVDLALLIKRGVVVTTARGGGQGTATAELALGLMIAAVRQIPAGDAAMRSGGFQERVGAGYELYGRTLGLIGLGHLGGRFARYANALDMKVLAWSQNLTAERAAEGGATLVNKAELLARSDVVSLHLVLSDRTRGIIGADDIALMKPGAILINTSRGPLIDEAAMIAALKAGRINAALDVYNREPLPVDHPLRSLRNVVMTPHLGYVTAENFAHFYRQCVANVLAWLDGNPINVMQTPP